MTSPKRLRGHNLQALLDIFWAAPADSELTAADLMETTGLTRTTTLELCNELIERGWVKESPVARAGAPGRVARRFTFSSTRDYVVGADVGYRSITSVVADLKGRVVGRARHEFTDPDSDRMAHVRQTVGKAVADSGVPEERIHVGCFGVAAPVDDTGKSPPGNPYWDMVSVDPDQIVEGPEGWHAYVENDANLAARAELSQGLGPDAGLFVTLLAGERLGAGIVSNGVVQRGAKGRAGEMGYLEFVTGVRSSDGIGRVLRLMAHASLSEGRESALRAWWNPDQEQPTAEQVLMAAGAGDPLAAEIVERAGERFATAIATLTMLDPSPVIIAGGIAEAAGPMIASIEAHLSAMTRTPPPVIASTLGRDVVLLGAVDSAIGRLRQNALDDVVSQDIGASSGSGHR